MTIPPAAFRCVLAVGLLAIAPAAVSAASLSDVTSPRDASHSFQRSELQLASTEGSGYYAFHLYSRFSAVSEGMRDRRVTLDDGPPPAAPGPDPIIVEPPTVTDPPAPSGPPVFTKPPALTDEPHAAAEPPTLLLIGSGLLAAASARNRKRR